MFMSPINICDGLSGGLEHGLHAGKAVLRYTRGPGVFPSFCSANARHWLWPQAGPPEGHKVAREVSIVTSIIMSGGKTVSCKVPLGVRTFCRNTISRVPFQFRLPGWVPWPPLNHHAEGNGS